MDSCDEGKFDPVPVISRPETFWGGTLQTSISNVF